MYVDIGKSMVLSLTPSVVREPVRLYEVSNDGKICIITKYNTTKFLHQVGVLESYSQIMENKEKPMIKERCIVGRITL